MGFSQSRLYILVAKYEFGLKIHRYMKEKSIEMEMGSPFKGLNSTEELTFSKIQKNFQ